MSNEFSEPSGQPEAINLEYPRYRGTEYPVPIATTREELDAIMEGRVKPGIEALRAQAAGAEGIDYVGSSIHPYFDPKDRFEFQNPEAAQQISEALLGTDAPVHEQAAQQDFFPEEDDCLDTLAAGEGQPNEGRWRHDDYIQSRFIVGPVVREHYDGWPASDDYNQLANLHFDPSHAVIVKGDVLMDAYCEYDPLMLEGYAVGDSLQAKVLEENYRLSQPPESAQENQ
jgi:hypothetical protein